MLNAAGSSREDEGGDLWSVAGLLEHGQVAMKFAADSHAPTEDAFVL